MSEDQQSARYDGSKENETPNMKGSRNEREAANILERVYGARNVDKVDAYANTDPLGFLDVLAAKEGFPVRFVQVKTNRFTAKDRRRYSSMASRFGRGVVCEVWVRVDREGWTMHRFDHDEEDFIAYLSMDTCNIEETIEAFREAVGYYKSPEDRRDDGQAGLEEVSPRA